MGPVWTPYRSQRPRGLLPCPPEKGGLATALVTTWSFTWMDQGSSSWQEQVRERPEPCTWAGLRQGWWPSKAPLKPSTGTCVDIHWALGTCLDPVQESKTTWIVPFALRKRADCRRPIWRPGPSSGWTCGVPPGKSRPVNGLNHVPDLTGPRQRWPSETSFRDAHKDLCGCAVIARDLLGPCPRG